MKFSTFRTTLMLLCFNVMLSNNVKLYLQINIKHEHRNNDNQVSYPSYVEVVYNGIVIQIRRNRIVWVCII